MPTSTVSNALAAEFNRRLGSLTGAPVLPTAQSLLEGTDYARQQSDNNRAAQIYDILKTSQQLQMLNKIGKNTGTGGGASTPGVLSDQTKTVLRAAKNSGFSDQAKPSPIEAAPFLASGPPLPVREAIARPIHFALDKLSRPFWAAFTGINEYEKAMNQGSNEVSALKAVPGGVWAGFSGHKHTGGGDIVETLASVPDSKNPIKWDVPGPHAGIAEGGADFLKNLLTIGENLPRVSPFSTFLSNKTARDIGGPMPYIQHGIKDVFGGALDVTGDPLNFAGGTIVPKIGPETEALARDASRSEKLQNALGIGAEKPENYSPELLHAKTMDAVQESLDKRGWLPGFNKKKWGATGISPFGGKTTGYLPTGVDRLREVVSKVIDDVLLQTHGGSTAGRVLGGGLLPQSMAAAVTEAIRKYHFEQFDGNLARYEEHLFGPNKLSAADIAARRAADPIFNSYMDEILKEMNKGRPKTPFATIDDALAHFNTRPTSKWNQWSTAAVKAAKKNFDTDFEDISQEIMDKLAGRIYNVPGVRVGSHVLPFDRIGRAYAGVAKPGRVADSALVSFNKLFPARTALANQKISSTGLQAFEQFRHEVVTASEGFTPEERATLTDSIVREYDFPGDPRMQAAKDFIQQKYEEMHLAENNGGVRTGKRVANYVYNHYKGTTFKGEGRPRNIRNYKKDVQEALAPQRRRSGPMRFAPDHVDKAVDKGLKPEQDAFRALLYRQMKSNRLLSKSHFTEDLLDHYGVLADNLSGTASRARNLEPVMTNIPKHIRDAMGPRQRWYLPKDIKQVYDNFTELASGSHNEGMSTFLKTYDKLLRLFKFSTTIPYPGFHIRNAIGDIFMSHFDGVRYPDYKRVVDLFKKRELHGPATAGQIFIGDRHFGFSELWDMFKKDASSGGFINTDISKTGGKISINPSRILGGLRTGSAFREDFFRFAHWLHAFREEYPKTLRTAGNTERAFRAAREAATYRVNKYLFDYNALTGTERAGLRRVIPFYTYTRKVMPSILEGAFLRPDILSKTNRMFLQQGPDRMGDMMPPDYLREIGYSKLPGNDKNPYLLSGGFLPTDTVSKNLNFSTNQGVYSNFLSQLSPLAKAPIELKDNKLLFNQQPIQSQRGYFLNSLFPLATNVASAIDTVAPGRPMNAVFNKLGLGPVTNKTGPSQIVSNRVGGGIPLSQLSDTQQNAAYYDARQGVYDTLKTYNDKLVDANIKIILSEHKSGTTYRVRDINTGKVYFESTDPQQAIQFAQQFASGK